VIRPPNPGRQLRCSSRRWAERPGIATTTWWLRMANRSSHSRLSEKRAPRLRDLRERIVSPAVPLHGRDLSALQDAAE
jgi:hypothetical protein